MCANRPWQLSLIHIYIHLTKTAALIVAAVRAGAQLGGADAETLNNLTIYAENLGLAFQIADDILDVVGSEEEMGTVSYTHLQSFIDGKPLFDSEVIMNNLLDVFLYEIKAGLILGVEIISICIVMGLLKNFSNSFGDKPVSTLGTVISVSYTNLDVYKRQN